MKRHHRAPAQPAAQREPAPVEGILELYGRVFPVEFFEQLSRELEIVMASRVFNWTVVILGMILQRLDSKGTLHAAVADLMPALEKLSDHRRVRERRVSSNPGAFSRARARLPMCVVERSFDHLFQSLHGEGAVLGGRAAFLLDGSTLTLEATPALAAEYPPGRNQHGESHWPILRVVVGHDLRTGLASRPEWGPQTVSEQALAGRLMRRLPPGVVIVGDRNFGIFLTAHQATGRRHPVVLRLTEARARALVGPVLVCGTDRRVCWRPSAWDRKAHPEIPADALINGRLLVERIEQDGKPVKLHVFTTWEEPAADILAAYGRRWHIETDLRSLKRTVRLHALRSKSPAMVEKELILGVAAYNLVRSFIDAAAQKAGLEPRELSFSYTQDLVYAALPALISATSPQEIAERLRQLLRHVASCKLPKRKKKRSYPRRIWTRRRSFPTYPTKRKPE